MVMEASPGSDAGCGLKRGGELDVLQRARWHHPAAMPGAD